MVKDNNTEYIRTLENQFPKSQKKKRKNQTKDMYRNLIEKETNGRHMKRYSTSLVILKC